MGGSYNSNNWWNARFKGLYIYGLSPFYQKAVFGSIGRELVLAKQFLRKRLLTLGPLVLGAYGVVEFAHWYHDQMERKKPSDYQPGGRFYVEENQ